LIRPIELAERFGFTRALQPLHGRWSSSLVVLAYHRVLPIEHDDSYPFDLDLLSATPEQFERQMAYLRRHFNVVSLHDVLAHMEGGPPLPSKAVAVTFDDGFGDTHRHAFPILRRYSIPATVFVSTGYVDSGQPFWFEVAAYMAMRAPPDLLQAAGTGEPPLRGETVAERRQSLRKLQVALKALPNDRRAAVVDAWTKHFTAHAGNHERAHGHALSWDQVREMAAAGIAFGSHSVTHPNLAHLSDAELGWELSESRRVLEIRLQRPIVTLAYPIGTRAAFNERVMAAARHAGFQLAVSYIRGANPLARLDRFALRRHGITRDCTFSYFRALTALPAWLG
jgi:peptidoglycan/xylan/chitin deacetylase (PgdA/CDA1 family)